MLPLIRVTIIFIAFLFCAPALRAAAGNDLAAAGLLNYRSFAPDAQIALPPDRPAKFRLDIPTSALASRDSHLILHPEFTFDMQPGSAQSSAPRPKAVSYGNGYYTRQAIHKYASIATLPLFVSEAIVGQKLFDESGDDSDSLKSAHTALAAGIGILFGVNTVTGVWNMWQARKDPNGRGKRLFHGILMLAADAGFVATAAMAPEGDDDDEREGGFRRSDDASTHRAVAFTSLGVAAFSYIYMLIAR